MTTTQRVENRFPGQCSKCQERVDAFEGTRLQRPDNNLSDKWDTQHRTCPTPDVSAAIAEEHPATAEQQAIYDAILRGEDVVVQAGAGTGKTSTQVGAARRLVAQAEAAGEAWAGQYTAFNAAIVAEAKGKFPSKVDCATVDSLALRALPDYKAELEKSKGKGATKKAPTNVEVAKALRITDLHLPTTDGNTKVLTGRVQAGIAKRALNKFCQSADEAPGAEHVEVLPEIDEVQQEKLATKILPVTVEIWQRLQSPKDAWTAGGLIFTAAKKIWQLSNPELPVNALFFDEAQDASPVMIAVIEHNKKLGKQIIVVGDSNQAINEWAGAIDSLPKFVALGATELYLTKSFRFGPLLAEGVANKILRRLPTDLVLEGFEKVGTEITLITSLSDGTNARLTRSNAGTVRELIDQIKLGRKVHLAGRNFGKELTDLCDACEDLQAGRRPSHPELVGFSTWSEVKEYADEDPNAGQMKLWVKLIDDVGAPEIRRAIASCVDKKQAEVIVSTAHKCKGEEFDTVVICGDFYPPKPGEGDLSPEELRLAYVAVTRAKKALDISRVPHFTQVGDNGSRFGTEFDEEGWAQ